MISLDGIIFSLQRNGGISVYFKELINYLAKENVSADVLLDESQKLRIGEIGSSIKLSIRKKRILERYRSCPINNGSSIFHSSYYRLPSKNIPTVVTVHDFVYERYSSGIRKLVHTTQKNAAIRAAKAVICISQATKDDLLEFVGETPGQKIYVVHNGVSDIFRVCDKSPAQNPFILFVGLRGDYKNFKIVLDAMSLLPELELHCVGGGAIKASELQGLAETVLKRVKHLGYVTDEELNALYNNAVCLVYPSKYEGFGIPIIEAMRAGCPVVSVQCKAVLEVGKTALIVAAESDPRAIADSILRSMSADRSEIIRQGLSIAQDYSWISTHRQTLEIYRHLGI